MLSSNDFQIPGLRRIAVLDPADLPPFIREAAITGVRPVIAAPARDIDFFGNAELSFSHSEDGKETTTLSFSTADYVRAFDVAFVVEDMHRVRRVVGAWELPYPTVKVEASTGGAPGDSRKRSYSVTWAGYPSVVTAYLDDDDKLPITDEVL